jgi:hypothetical protein
MPAVREFLRQNHEWRMVEFHENCHGLAVMERDSQKPEAEWPRDGETL